jgi:hypothetical protein
VRRPIASLTSIAIPEEIFPELSEIHEEGVAGVAPVLPIEPYRIANRQRLGTSKVVDRNITFVYSDGVCMISCERLKRLKSIDLRLLGL